MTFDTPVSTLPFVGPQYTKLLDNLGITTIGQLLYHLPSRYLDLSKMTEIDQLVADEIQVIQAKVWEIKKVRIKGGRVLITVLVGDASGSIALTWFNQPFIEKSLRQGETYRFAGEVEQKFGKLQMTNPTHELASKPMVHTGRLVPIYPQTAGLSSKWLRARIAPLLPKVESIVSDFLPTETIKRHQLLDLPMAIKRLHQPATVPEATQARHRLAFDELLLLQLSAAQRKAQWQANRRAARLAVSTKQLADYITSLPFQLTKAQQKSLDEILTDLTRDIPMNRLLEGDVGSGKTVIAFLAALVTVQAGYQVVLMAPTSVLAQQHYLTFQALLARVSAPEHHMILGQAEDDTIDGDGSNNHNPPSTLSLRTSKSKMEAGEMTIGTHALIAEGMAFDRLGLVIIDEQHRFGVEQRAALMAKAQQGVHVLTMTATPIPRTLALTSFSDLDLSIIDQLPSNRLPIKTHIVPDKKRADMYGFIQQALARGEQAYVICPLIEESETLTSVRSATAEFERLQSVFTNFKLGLLHGRMKPADKDQVLADFKAHTYDLLVATPVVEVGIDVPNATILIVEAAERFGLAQLHQLRGRVGRGEIQSFCFLLSDAIDPMEVARLGHLERERSGIKLAELDLQTRGPGEVYGVRQSGIPELKAASFFDLALIEATQAEALKLLDQLNQFPLLQQQLIRSQPAIELN